ncbi:putative ribonuclease H-like domain-containing protein [Tanacetum coccineum]
MWPADLLFSQNLKDSPDAGFKPSREEEKKDAHDPGNKSGNPTEGKDSEVPSTKEPRINQEKDDNINNTNNINIASDGNNTNNVNAVSSTVNAAGIEVNAMDVKSHFLYRKIEEEVYVYQPPGFEDPDFPDRVYKVEKALYGLHQAPRAWYETLSTYLLDDGFQRGKIDKTLFIRRVKSDILLIQVYVDDIIFGFTKKSLCIEFEKIMHKKF